MAARLTGITKGPEPQKVATEVCTGETAWRSLACPCLTQKSFKTDGKNVPRAGEGPICPDLEMSWGRTRSLSSDRLLCLLLLGMCGIASGSTHSVHWPKGKLLHVGEMDEEVC